MLCQPKVSFEAELDVASIHEREKGVKKQPAVVIIKKYSLAGIAPGGQLIDGSREFNAKRACHSICILPKLSYCKT